MIKDLPELKKIRNLIHLADDELVRASELVRINLHNKSFPMIGFEI